MHYSFILQDIKVHLQHYTLWFQECIYSIVNIEFYQYNKLKKHVYMYAFS